MKLFLGHLIGFGMVTALCFVMLSAFALCFPLLGAFLTWSLEPVMFDFGMTMFIARAMLLISAFVGIAFTVSKEGRELAADYAKGE